MCLEHALSENELFGEYEVDAVFGRRKSKLRVSGSDLFLENWRLIQMSLLNPLSQKNPANVFVLDGENVENPHRNPFANESLIENKGIQERKNNLVRKGRGSCRGNKNESVNGRLENSLVFDL